MAGQIAKVRFDLTVHDLRRDAAAPLLNEGAAWADSPKDVAERSDIVCTCLPGPAEMEPGLSAGRHRLNRGASSRRSPARDGKDFTPATELAEEVGVPVQLAEACRAEMNEALERGLGGLDSSVALTLQEERAEVQVRLA